MTRFAFRAAATLALTLSVAACGGGGIFGTGTNQQQPQRTEEPRQSTVWDLFSNRSDSNKVVAVNKYLWNASLEVLNFLPIESVDPFTGVIVTGYGRPPGGGRAYRATIYVQDPALEARSLKVSLQSQGGGAVSPETARAVEDAILTRARQLRIRDSKL